MTLVSLFYLVQFYTVSSSPVDVPQIKYGAIVKSTTNNKEWSWSDVSNPIFKCSDKVLLIFLFEYLFKLIKRKCCMLKLYHWKLATG